MKKKKWTILGKYQQACSEQNMGKRSDLKCSNCGLRKFLTVDHIIPVFLLEQFCLNDEIYNLQDNFQILCKFCNYKKGAKMDVRNPKTFQLLNVVIGKVQKELYREQFDKETFEKLGLKICKILDKKGITNLEGLAKQKDEELLKLKGVGSGSLFKINRLLIRNDLR